MATKTDYYSTLGISKGASAEEIKRAYRKLALEWHPDRHKDNKETAEKKFKEVNEAYQVLSDPKRRQQYDQYGSSYAPPGGASAGRSPFTYSYSTSNGENPFGNVDPFEIFEQFFGGAFSRRPQVPRYSMSLEFMEAVKGIEKEVQIEGKKRKIKIPAGVDDGQRINFGDFILTVNVRGHKTFERDGADIYVRVAIPFSVATLGGTIEVPTVEGNLGIKVKAGTQNGIMLRLPDRGAPRVGGRGKGDEFVRIIVATPTRLNRQQRRIIEEMRREGL